MARKLIETQKTTLTYGISDVSTTIQLKNLLKLDGTSVAASDIGDLLYGTFGPGTSKEEIFSINGANVTVETNGNITITGVVRGLMEVSPYTTGGFSTDHSSGEVVIFGNNPQVYQDIYDYIDAAVVGGGVDASTTVKGISKLSTAPASPSNPIAVGDNDPRIPTTNYTAAMAGTLGTPSATNKFVTSDNTYTGETDQEQTTQNATVEFGMPNTSTNKNKIVQSFIPLKTKIRGVKLYKAANTGTFTGTVTVELFANSGGNPTGSALTTKTFTNVEYNTFAVGEIEVIFTEYSMTTGSTYHLVISASTADGSNHPNIGTNSAGGYANGSVKYWNSTDGYVAVATIDLYFKTLQGENSQIIQTDTTGVIPSTFYDISKMPMPAYQQDFPTSSTETISATFSDVTSAVGSNKDGSALYIGFDTSMFLYRFRRDTLTGKYLQTHRIDTTVTGTSTDTGAIIVIGDYIYWFANDGTNIKCTRFLAADLTGEQVITVPTVACNGDLYAWTDGVNAYVVSDNSSTTSRKWSVSGTTFTAISTASISSILNPGNVSMFDGTNAYILDSNGSTTGPSIVKLNNIDGSTVTSTTTFTLGASISGVQGIPLLVNIDSNRMYLGFVYQNYNENNADAIISTNIRLYPVTKP